MRAASRPDSVIAAEHGSKGIQNCSEKLHIPLCLPDKCDAHQVDRQTCQIEIACSSLSL